MSFDRNQLTKLSAPYAWRFDLFEETLILRHEKKELSFPRYGYTVEHVFQNFEEYLEWKLQEVFNELFKEQEAKQQHLAEFRIINFSHPLSNEQLEFIQHEIGKVTYVIDVAVQLDFDKPFGPQMESIIDSLDFDRFQWSLEEWIVILPSLSIAAALCTALLYNRMQKFPMVMRLKPVNGITTTYEFAELIDLSDYGYLL